MGDGERHSLWATPTDAYQIVLHFITCCGRYDEKTKSVQYTPPPYFVHLASDQYAESTMIFRDISKELLFIWNKCIYAYARLIALFARIEKTTKGHTITSRKP